MLQLQQKTANLSSSAEMTGAGSQPSIWLEWQITHWNKNQAKEDVQTLVKDAECILTNSKEWLMLTSQFAYRFWLAEC